MALTTTQSITVTGLSTVMTETGEVIAASMNASLNEEGGLNVVTTILNKEAYEANKAECRADIDAFTDVVRAIEDEE